MTALIITAILAWVGPSLALAAWWLLDRSREQTWADERASFDDESTPTYDALVCEFMERAEGWA